MQPTQIVSGSEAIAMGSQAGKLWPVAGTPHLRVIRAVNVPSGGVNFTENEVLGDNEGLLLTSILASTPASYTLRLGGGELDTFTGRIKGYSPGILLIPAQSLEIYHTLATPVAFIQITLEYCLIHGPVTII